VKLANPVCRVTVLSLSLGGGPLAAGCGQAVPSNQIRVSGYVEATEVQIAAEVGGRIVELHVDEGDRVTAGGRIARLDTADTELALLRAGAEREYAQAQLRLLLAGSRAEDIRQAEAQVSSADADIGAAEAELASAEVDLGRFESLLRSSSSSLCTVTSRSMSSCSTRRSMSSRRRCR